MIKLPIIRTTIEGGRDVTELRFHTGWAHKNQGHVPFFVRTDIDNMYDSDDIDEIDDIDDSENDGTSKYRFIDIDNQPVSGVFYEIICDRKFVLIISTGFCVRLYSYPDVEIPFRSPMTRWWNLFYCGGWIMHDSSDLIISEDSYILRAVASGQKPIGFLYRHKTDLTDTLNIIAQYNLVYSTTPAKYSADMFEIGVCTKVKVGEIFNISAVLRSYELLSIAQGETVFGREDIEFFTSLQDRPLESFLTGWDYANPITNCDFALTGLLLGYPIESTFALMC